MSFPLTRGPTGSGGVGVTFTDEPIYANANSL